MKTVSIIGSGGMVGGTLYKWFPEAKAYDKFKESPNTLEEAVQSDIVFVSIWLDENGRTEKDKQTLDEIVSKVPDGKVVVFKCTIVPGTTDYFQDKYPNKLFVHNPEFLSEATAQWDFENPPAQIIGCTQQSLKVAIKLLEILPKSPVQEIISARDAEMYKHLRNAYLAMKVIVFNQFHDACKALNVDYDTLRQVFIRDSWLGATHTQIWHKGFRGYGGKCLPKEVRCLLDEVEDAGIALPLFDLIEELNKHYGEQRER